MVVCNVLLTLALAACVCVCVGQGAKSGAGDINHEGCGVQNRSYVQVLMSYGSIAEPNMFPWHVGIFREDIWGGFENICGGSLISLRIVVSAAHCFYNPNTFTSHPARSFRVVAGTLLRTWNSKDTTRQESKVLEIHLTEKFAGLEKNFQEDIALLLLTSQLEYSGMVRPVCLDLSDPDFYGRQVQAGKEGLVAGWGVTENNEVSEVLKYMKIRVIAENNCTVMSREKKHTRFLTADKICAGHPSAAILCQGDSGGGLVFSDSRRYYLRGLVSNGPSSDLSMLCTPGYVLFTNIDSHKEWLSTKIGELQSVCTLKDGRMGICRPLSHCPRAIELMLELSLLPQACPGENRVCCEESCRALPQKTNSKAFNYCIEVAEKVFPCPAQGGERCPAPNSSGQLFSNSPMSVAQIPYYVKLGKGTRGDIEWWCRAVLVSERWLLGAAKCVNEQGPMQYARTGGGTERRFTAGSTYSISQQIIHPSYLSNLSLVYNDISLLQLETPVTFSSTVMPACLHTGGLLPSELVHLGWNNDLKEYAKTTMKPIRNVECSGVFPADKEYLPQGVRSAVQVCAQPSTASDCQSYYSGSPLQASNNDVPCTQLLVGLSSAWEQKPCTRIFLRVAAFIDWIERIVWP